MCLLCELVVCSECAVEHKYEKHRGSWIALTFADRSIKVEGQDEKKGCRDLYFDAFMMPYGMKGAGEKKEEFWLQEEQLQKATGEFLSWY